MSCFFITHPEVVIDPSVPIEDWGLSDAGRARAAILPKWMRGEVRSIFSSAEKKARETAAILGEALGLDVTVDPALGEMDRSATGYLQPDEFERIVDEFFAFPDQSVRGWERAVDAQHRIERAVRGHLQDGHNDAAAFVGHGGVGGLLLGSLSGRPISRNLDQPGMGSYFIFNAQDGRASLQWRRVE
ncbi:histidine phosphatase family protein [Leifsonia sp. 2MCAF36]|uniref:histidine phosphatase family protein n=1 Tax=Leifsonia sp. 2MCAF36 TaxID=3232988 RepID=UPI003F9B4ADF